MKRNHLIALLLCAALLLGAVPGQYLAAAQDTQISVSFDANGGSGDLPEPISCAAGQAVTLPDAQLNAPPESGIWRFAGWAADLTAYRPEYLPGDKFTPAGSVTLYAVYTSSACTVTYRVGGSSSIEQVAPGGSPSKVPKLPEEYLGWRDRSGAQVDPAQAVIQTDTVFTAYRNTALNTDDHSKYMDGESDGLFYPDRSITRAQAAQVVYELLTDRPDGRAEFTDVPQDAWYAKAASALCYLGILSADEDGRFLPDAAMTRGAFAQMLDRFVSGEEEMSTFSDVPADHPYSLAIGRTAARGLFGGYPDGTFRPSEPLTRAQAAAVLNKLLGRAPQAGAIAARSDVRIFPDVPSTHWAYADVMEASITHDYTMSASGETWTTVQRTATAMSDGFHTVGGWLYKVENGAFLRSTTRGDFTFDAEGRYTTGSATLDEKLHNIIVTYTNDSMTRDQKLRALFNYVRDNYSYLKRDLIAKGTTGWEPAYAEKFLDTKKGNCFSFSATYCLLARELGLPAYTVIGGLGRNNSPHGWVEIELDGKTYMFDTQLEWRYLHDYGIRGYNLFKMLPSKAPFTYHW